jgi:hypothetical protein
VPRKALIGCRYRPDFGGIFKGAVGHEPAALSFCRAANIDGICFTGNKSVVIDANAAMNERRRSSQTCLLR